MANTKKISELTNTDILRVGDSIPITRGAVSYEMSHPERINFEYEEDAIALSIDTDGGDTTIFSPDGLVSIQVEDGGVDVTGDVTVVGNLGLDTAGNKLTIATGANASIGVSGAMTAGTITISTTAVTADSKIFLTHATVAGTQGILSVGTIVAGTSFVINSSSATDTSTVNWWIIN